ncbi:DUF563 domain-containing protein [Fulvivirgaceae bacterium LMO-SS25]
MSRQVIFEKHSLERALPENYQAQDFRHFDGDIHNTIREMHVVEFNNASILQFFLFHKGQLLDQYCATRPIHWKKRLKAYVKSIIYPSITINEATWLIDNWSAGYFHWITDVLPRILVAKQYLPLRPILLPESFQKLSFVQESIQLLEVNVIYYQPFKKYKIKQLGLTSHLSTCNFNIELMQQVRSFFASKDSGNFSKHSKRIYISRSKANRRRVLNEEELMQLLSKYDISCFYMEDLSFAQQRKLMAETQFLISNHGAGLTNMTFMQEGATVFELKSDSINTNNCFFNLARALNHQYYYTINSGQGDHIQYTDIVVDLEKLAVELRRILNF